METFLQDLRYALRQLRKAPGFAITAVITLALGIGANTAIFTLVQGILLRSLPVADPALLYRVGDTDNCCVNGGFVSDNGDFDIFSYDLYLHLKNSAPEFEQLAAVQAGQPRFSVRRGNALGKSLHGEFVSGNYFSTLGVSAFSGRPLTENDDTPSSAPATVLSYRAWQTEFAGDRAIIGSTISIQPIHSSWHCPARFLDASGDRALPLRRGEQHLASCRLQLALRARPRALRDQHWRLAGEAFGGAPSMAIHAFGLHPERWRSRDP